MSGRVQKESSVKKNLIDQINTSSTLYEVLGCHKRADQQEIRRAYLARCRHVHPDKFPTFNPEATAAFQKLSFAHTVLSSPEPRKRYDLTSASVPSSHPSTMYDSNFWTPNGGLGEIQPDETLHNVLFAVFSEFLDGDFRTLRSFFAFINETAPGLTISPDAVDHLEGVFRRIREIMIRQSGYTRVVRFELIRLYEIQSSLRSLRWLDLRGRLRLGLQLTRVVISIPLVLDNKMKDEAESGFVEERRRLASIQPNNPVGRNAIKPTTDHRTNSGHSSEYPVGKQGEIEVIDEDMKSDVPSHKELEQARLVAGLLGPRLHATL
ncbi:Molecular chaperone (DnaJ superfamily) [Phaffia rhodozyma]|uniref:Molecular chaperone (DnaJ superfamily) n=1 Tax=Phaffia rhodozyma TaxID=264483 RepID=A0A0F7SV24_PHARH|nr:Molecular chaperone (DnaJ superfamily) [Phaffia rhodozyma]